VRSVAAATLLAILGPASGAVASPDPRWVPPPQCAAAIAAAATGAWSGCDTEGNGVMQTPGRAVTLAVQAGVASATLTCGGENLPDQVTITAVAPFTASGWVANDNYCYVRVTSLYPGTTAVATNTSTIDLALVGP
jgi:hypothetical protein